MTDPNPLEKQRLDLAMVARNLVRSRSLATDLIKRGKVSVNGKSVTKPNTDVTIIDKIEIDQQSAFVSRGGEKLAFALDTWGIPVAGLTAVDVGSSTGGFTDCLLKKGAAKVYAVDVGSDQLDPTLRYDERVEVHENTDIRDFSLPQGADMATIDVSFISIILVLPKVYELLKPGGIAVALIKPQFEVGKELADKFRGVITDEDVRAQTLERVKAGISEIGFEVMAQVVSPITGEKGNTEFLLLLQKSAQ